MIFLGCPPSSSAAPSRLGQITDFITRRAPYWAQHSVFLNWSVFFTVLPLCYNTVLYLGKLFLDAVSALLCVLILFPLTHWNTTLWLFRSVESAWLYLMFGPVSIFPTCLAILKAKLICICIMYLYVLVFVFASVLHLWSGGDCIHHAH